MKISLVIPAYNESQYIGQCLDSIIQNSKGRLYEILVIDNASTDNTASIAESKGIRVIREEKKGTSYARERGLLESTGDLVAFLDADTKMTPFWVDIIEKTFASEPNTVCLSGPYRYYDGSKFRNFFAHALWFLTIPITYYTMGFIVIGGNFVARRNALLAMEGFNHSIAFYGDDTDIGRRLKKFGKVKFDFSFYVRSSSRRYAKEGLMKTNITYAMNYFSQIFFHKSVTKKYKDIR